MAYIIKRAVQHSVFLPESERPPPGVKPGQDLRVPPQDITTTYTTAASARQPDHTYLRHTTFTDASEYGKCFANVTKMDCVVQRKDLAERYQQRRERKAKRSDQLSEGATSFDQKAHELSSARHWTTSYRADFIETRGEGDWSIAGTKPQVRGGVTAVVPVRCVTEDTGISSFTERYGEYGSAPRDLIADPTAAQLPVKITALEDGTTKGGAFRRSVTKVESLLLLLLLLLPVREGAHSGLSRLYTVKRPQPLGRVSSFRGGYQANHR
ncbi:hypothetical protein FOZ63_025932 [Perkinsus olseni]|uniref:Uncharacterized protein n=1 Tax=Perkinsus olseni TaxID=32597 RepID=A0A7J6PYM9_PEROL|nr:hypothetical protein FOZ63_025932 [Perkinsus olseni]KAF4731044.1 hypothetical protein FOZ62_008124 [Perkinsus olseni]